MTATRRHGHDARTGAVRPSATETAIMVPATARRGRWWLLGLAATAAVASGVGVLVSGGRGPASVVQAVAIDAAVDGAPVARARPELDSSPPGAIATVGGVAYGPTPTTVEVAAGTIELRLDLPGYGPYLDRITVNAGQTLRIRAPMLAALARLTISSRPSGATVQLDGEQVGTTPLTLTALAARPRARITLELADYLPYTGTVDLIAGEQAVVERVLRPAPTPTGVIQLQIEDGWGEVFLKGRKVGKAPNQALKLPVGRHRLRIVNPPSGREVWLEVDVDANRTGYYSTRLPP